MSGYPILSDRDAPGLGRPALWALAVLVCLALESLTGLDRLVQDIFFRQGAWLISEETHAGCKAWLYTGPKVGIGLIGAASLGVGAASLFWGKMRSRLAPFQKPAGLILLSVSLIPLLAAAGKASSGVWGPLDTLPYGGSHAHTGLLAQLWLYGQTAGGHSFPAGHASGGFALMSLYYLPLERRWRKALLLFGFAAGWGMGLYQMARGQHFLSHTLTTMCLAFLLITCLAQVLRLQVNARERLAFWAYGAPRVFKLRPAFWLQLIILKLKI